MWRSAAFNQRTVGRIGCSDIRRANQQHPRRKQRPLSCGKKQPFHGLEVVSQQPDDHQKAALEDRFDALFTRKTGFTTLYNALGRIYGNKTELLLVIERPDIPLHNNLSERDIREYVRKRKISASSTRRDKGRRFQDTFTSLKKTCRKLGISFWNFLMDRIELQNKYPPLAELISTQLSASPG